ncbi:PREDICTED: RNA/RNP complex-1-interacting phosphatase-like isoform X1 [Poecilia mexicana]|uniref:RNA/RNP complex-1-interacting phosphatase n=1 Tax=Poecilia mexicana TaxID=48701 RepID=A0A3B3XCS1_9TELE|nr:PREDICTED: RNA/RNP complex-1-interacting phosphatase-like isoform X1 [Poecilia mexicana]
MSWLFICRNSTLLCLKASAGNRTLLGVAMSQQQQQQQQQKKKKKKKTTGIPDGWLDYCPVGSRIPGTRFIPFKVPLKAALNCQLPASQSFDLWDLLDSVRQQNQELGLIIDLTFTTRYYSVSDIPQCCAYIKIPTEGHRVPNDGAILSFKRAVRHFLSQNQDNSRLIGVHCTHGLNRTGYLICRYLIDVDRLDAAAALQLFNSSRGHHIERKNYIRDLQHAAKRSNRGIDEPERNPIMGLAVRKEPATLIKHQEKVESNTVAQHVKASGDESAENQQPKEKQPSQKQTKRRARRRYKTRDKKSADGSAQGHDPAS